MSRVTYKIVEHDGGWAYKVGDVFSESFPTKTDAHAAAVRAAREQQAPGETTGIEFEDKSGHWHQEVAKGSDRSQTDVWVRCQMRSIRKRGTRPAAAMTSFAF